MYEKWNVPPKHHELGLKSGGKLPDTVEVELKMYKSTKRVNALKV